jgi:alpha-L-rhamnosidase
MLAKYGYIDDAWKLFVQKETPGWMHWLESGDGTLYENWESDQSHNHVMFADYSAWAYEYVAGIVPVAPGFAKVALRPNFLEGVESFSASYQTKYGRITASWKRENGKPVFTYSLPEGVELATEGESSYPR